MLFALDSSGRTAIDPQHVFAMDTTGVTQAGACAKQAMPVDEAHELSASLQGFLIQNGYCNWVVPENHDEQRFRVHRVTDGPFVHTVATPWIWGYRDPKPFEKYWVNVAIVDVDAPTGTQLPREYTQRLHLKPGQNCLFLHYRGAPSPGWQATMVEASGTSCIPTIGGPPAETIPVAVDAPSSDFRDYPAVTRFMEAVDGGTFVGVRCGNAWCVAGAQELNEIAPASHKSGQNAGSSSRWRISGWFDDQHLAMQTTDPGAPDGLAPGGQASAVPADNLASIPFTAFTSGWQMVATVYMPDKPQGKYGSSVAPGYGLKPGVNPVWLHASVEKVNVGPGSFKIDTVWGARFGNRPFSSDLRTQGVRTLRVVRTDHTLEGFPVPGTARWRWMKGDEQLWTACMVGCCRVQPDDLH